MNVIVHFSFRSQESSYASKCTSLSPSSKINLRVTLQQMNTSMGSRNPTSSPLSSAQSSQATFQTASSQSHPRFRPIQVLPFELLQQVKVYLEESLFTQALRFLQSLLSTTAADGKRKALIPPPDYLAFLSTVTIHPSFTTRSNTPEKISQSNAALKFLWTINRTTGPINSCLADAYRFHRYDVRVSRRSEADSETEEDFRKDMLNSNYADSESIFSLAEDFWAVVGWALNCACLPGIHAARWGYWGPWLEYMLDVLETDWELREETDAHNHSLLWQYVRHATGGTARGRRVLRAIFADGSPSTLKEFKDIFRKELKEPKSEKARETERNKKQEVAVDVDQEIYGDWMQEEETSSDDEDTAKRDDILQQRPSKRLRARAPRNKKNPLLLNSNMDTDDSDASTATQDDKSQSRGLGPPDAIAIRLRLLQLLSNLSASLTHTQLTPTQNQDFVMPDLHELYTLYVEFIRPLSLPAFQKIILPNTTITDNSHKTLTPESRVALCEFILQRLVDSDTPNSGISTFEPMTQTRLVAEYLPYPAARNTIEAQVKVSLLLESLMRVLTSGKNDVLRREEALTKAVIVGIEDREEKARAIREGGRQRKGKGIIDEEVATELLKESGMRMRVILDTFVAAA